jgi:glycosyltransferase involved in cell wall biosynthesis
MNPPVIFGMTVYNSAPFLRAAVDSILNQSISNLVLVAVDNCSTDNSEEILREYVSSDPRVRYFKNETNLGQVKNWNLALQHSREEVPEMDFFVWAGDHDFWEPNWLEVHLEYMTQFPDAALVYPMITAIDANGKSFQRKTKFPSFQSRGTSTSRRAERGISEVKGIGNMVYGLFRADAIRHSSGLPCCIRPDGPFLYDVLTRGEIIQIPQPLWSRRYPDHNGATEDIALTYDQHLTRLMGHTFDGKPPWYANFPTFTHAVILVWTIFRNPPESGIVSRFLGFSMAARMLKRRRSWIYSETRWLIGRIWRTTSRSN